MEPVADALADGLGDALARYLRHLTVERQSPKTTTSAVARECGFFLDYCRECGIGEPAKVDIHTVRGFLTRSHRKGLQPPTLITSDVEAIYDFRERHGDMVLKPLHGGGGSGVVRLKAAPDVLRVRVGMDHRMLFRLLPETVQIVDLINRRDLEKRIRSL